MVCKVNIVRLDLSEEKSQEIVDYIAEEVPFHLYINKTFWATILCSPTDLKELAVGHFLSEGILKSIDEIADVVLKESDRICYIRLKPNVNVENRIKISRLHARVIPSVCGSGSPHQFTGKISKIKSNLKVKAQVVSNSVRQLNFKAAGFRRTGGLHVAAIYKANGQLIALAEDVGRHSAVDKVIGIAALNDVTFGECFLALSGRISGDVAFKAAKVNLPIIASLAAALSSGITLAESAGLTLAGFVRGNRINLYTCSERISLNILCQ